jgi:phosphoribosylaminoimidazole carboxylase PurE protein
MKILARRRVFRQTRDVRSVRSRSRNPLPSSSIAEDPIDATSESGMLTPELETQLAEIEIANGPLVGVVMGSEHDQAVMQGAVDELKQRGIAHEVTVVSAHRDPELVREYSHGARARGLKVIIAGAGMAAALPGLVASHTDLPVIGVPIRAENAVSGGLDALLSIAQAPAGVPVACVAVNGAQNAAILAARILYA